MTTPTAARSKHNDDGRQVRVYPIPDPTTGELVEHPSLTSVLDVLQQFGLGDWKLKMAAVGLSARLDLQARIVAATPLDPGPARNRELLDVIELAIQHGQTLDPARPYLANDFGSAIHLLSEHVDDGRVDVLSLPANVREHVAGYAQLIEQHGVSIVESEFTVYSHHGYAGTGDRLVRFEQQPPDAADVFATLDLGRGCFVADIKTGRLKESAAMQLAALVNADTIWDAETNTHRPLPDDLRRDVGFLLHVTADGGALVPVDLVDAWPAYLGALIVKRFVETKPLRAPLTARRRDPSVPPTPPPTLTGSVAVRDADEIDAAALRTDWMIGRLRTLADLKAQVDWPQGVLTFKQARAAGVVHELDELARIEQAIDAAEMRAGAPFPDVDPTDRRAQFVNANDERVLDVKHRLAALASDHRELAIAAAKAAGANDVAFGGTAAALDIWHVVLLKIELDAAQRRSVVDNAVGALKACGVDLDMLVAAVGPFVDLPTAWQAERLDDLADCASADVLVVDEAGALLVVHEALLAQWSHDRRSLLAAARLIARRWKYPAPANSQAVLNDVLLAAALYLTDDEQEEGS